jgi:type I restriction enzyme S subunit
VTHDVKKTDLMYLYYALKTKNLSSFARGVKPGINRNDVYELEISFPPLVRQREIVAKLEAVSLAVSKSKKSYADKVSQLVALKQSIFKKAFTNELVKE